MAGLMMFCEETSVSSEVPGFSLDYRGYESVVSAVVGGRVLRCGGLDAGEDDPVLGGAAVVVARMRTHYRGMFSLLML